MLYFTPPSHSPQSGFLPDSMADLSPAATNSKHLRMNILLNFARRRSPPEVVPKLDRLQLSDDEDVPGAAKVSSTSDFTGHSNYDRSSRVLRVSGLDGVGVDVEIHSRDSVGLIKSRISAATGVHKDLQDVFDADAADEASAGPFDDDEELPDAVTDLTVINKPPDLHKVTPGAAT